MVLQKYKIYVIVELIGYTIGSRLQIINVYRLTLITKMFKLP